MNLDHLKTFHYVARLRSFTKAAHELFLTQPAVSLQIQGLEHSLKATLFDRRKKKIELTEEGRILFGYTQRLFGLFDDIESAFQDLSQLQLGHLEIASSAVVGTYYLPDILATFKKRYPKIQLNLRIGNSEQVADWVMNRDVDLGLCARIVGKNGLVQYQILNEAYRPVVAPFSQWAQLGRPLTPAEFVKASIVTREKGARSQSKLDTWLKEQGLDSFNGGFTVNSMTVAKYLAMSGLGIVTLPELVTRKDVETEHLVYLDVENFNLHTGYYVNYLEDTNLSPAALKFLMLLKENRRDFMAII